MNNCSGTNIPSSNKKVFIWTLICKGGSPLSDWKLHNCKIRSLSMPSISCCLKPHVFISFAQLKKKVQLAWTFFWLLANDDVKVNKTQKISAKIDRFRTRLC